MSLFCLLVSSELFLPDQIKAAIRPDTRFIILAAVNNETGVKHDTRCDRSGRIRGRGSLSLSMASAWMGKEPLAPFLAASQRSVFQDINSTRPKESALSLSALRLKLTPCSPAANKNTHMRAGTENLPGIVGLAKAVELLNTELPAATHRMAMLRDKLEAGLIQKADPVVVNGMGPGSAILATFPFPILKAKIC